MSSNSMALNIQQFAEGASADAGVSDTSAAAAQPQTGENGAKPESVSDAGGQNTAENVTLDGIFKEHPELRKEYQKGIDNIVGKRLAAERAKVKPVNDIIDKLMVSHGVESLDELAKIVDEKAGTEFAAENGVSEDMGKEIFNARMMQMQDRRAREYFENQQRAEAQLRLWEEESRAVAEAYPEFDLRKELENPDFKRLISAENPQYRMPMKQIYEMLHHEELVAAAESRAAAAYSKSIADNNSRPKENGLGNQSAVSGKTDVAKLSKKERAELAERAMRGEKITF